MHTREMKDGVFGQFARIGKALAAPKRIELLELLCQGPRTVESLAQQAGISVANASQHLQVLRRARVIDAQKKGLYVEYRVADEQVLRFVHALRTLAESRLAEIGEITNAFLKERGSLERVSAKELLRRVRDAEVTVLDVRPAQEYRAGHIPGARSVPLKELRKRLSELPKSRDIVAYCRGPHCVMAMEAVRFLRSKGFRAHRMEEGVVDWRVRGWRVEKSPEEVRP
ncbi:MAG TPA: metalloregulator ArsR/SmtB family transcription factor [Steroidobacteraceae bacterium]